MKDKDPTTLGHDMPIYIPKCSARLQGIDKLFDTLKIRVENRTQNLQHLLNRSLMTDTNSIGDSFQLDEQTYFKPVADSVTRTDLQSLLKLRLSNGERLAIKLAINLLVEMSTFPHCTKNIALDRNGMNELYLLLWILKMHSLRMKYMLMFLFIEKELPNWLKVLCLIAAYSYNDRELQLSAITTLFDLIRLVEFFRRL